jgi:hypothetical protein
MTLADLRDWHMAQFFEAKDARDYCCDRYNAHDMTNMAGRATLAAIKRFDDLCTLHLDAVVNLDQALSKLSKDPP